jgi:hypothetical protein
MSTAPITLSFNSNGFTPRQIATLSLWLDAADASTLAFSSGINVSQWNDKSGNGYNFTTVSGTPTYTSSSPFTKCVVFNSGRTNDLMRTTTVFYQPMTVFVVSTQRGSSNAQFAFILSTATNAPPAPFSQFQYYNNNLSSEANGSIQNSAPTASFVNPTTGLYTFTLNGASTTLTRDGALPTGFLTNTPPGFNGVVLGKDWSGLYNIAEYAEIIFYSSALSTIQYQQVEGYLAWKWGLQGNLPATHPYKNLNIYAQPQVVALALGTLIVPRPLFAGVTLPTNFTPLNVSNCTLWLDGADPSSISLSGSRITQWNDKSGNGYNFVNASTGPTYSANTVTFNGSTNSLSNMSITIPATTHTLIAVHKPTTITGNYQGNTSLFRFQPGQFIVFPYMDVTTPRGYITSFSSGAVLSDGNSTLVENSSTTSYNIIVANITSSSQKVFKNGSIQSGAAATLTGSTIVSMYLGSLASNNTEFYQGELLEMIIYSVGLSPPQQEQIEAYLALKWGLLGNLPLNHPYKNRLTMGTKQFSPRNIASLLLWIDASDRASFTLSGSSVTAITDKSGAGSTVTSIDYQPTYSATGLNGCPTFNMTAGQFRGQFGSAMTNYYTHTAFVVTNVNAPISDGFTCVSYAEAVTGSASFYRTLDYYNTTSLFRSVAFFNSTAATVTVSSQTPSPFLWSESYSSSASSMNAKYNGSQLTPASFAPPSGNTTPSYFFVGCSGLTNDYTTNPKQWNGNISEILVYNSVLSVAQIQQVEGYLAWKWGLQASLPPSHPFRRFPPPPQ